jgi:hypothetical protein
VDYKKLAEELGGRAEPQSETETPAVDYRALAEQYGGVQEEEQPLEPLSNPLRQPLGNPLRNLHSSQNASRRMKNLLN